MQLKPGLDFTPADMERNGREAAIHVNAHVDTILTGGMTYQLDPRMKAPVQERPQGPSQPDPECGGNVGQILNCVDLSGAELKKVRVRKVTVDIHIKEDEC